VRSLHYRLLMGGPERRQLQPAFAVSTFSSRIDPVSFKYLRAKRREQRSNYHVSYHLPCFRASFSFCCVQLKKIFGKRILNTANSFF
jgi:hypothetical protein